MQEFGQVFGNWQVPQQFGQADFDSGLTRSSCGCAGHKPQNEHYVASTDIRLVYAYI